MEKRSIGSTQLKVTAMGFGGTSIGGLFKECSREAAMETLEGAWASGIRYFDTAPYYGSGLSERRFGDFLSTKPDGSYVLSTKVGRLLSPVPRSKMPHTHYFGSLPFEVVHDYSYDGIMRSFDMSHARLGLNKIDILYVHGLGASVHGAEHNAIHMRHLFDGGLKALEELKSSGSISAWGLGVAEIQVCLDVLAQVRLDCILLAGRYSLLDRTAEADLIEVCRKQRTSLVIGGVFNSGILATGATAGACFNYKPASQEVLDRVSAMEKVASLSDIPLAAGALQFPLLNPSVACVLVACANLALVHKNTELMRQPVPSGFYSAAAQWAIR